MTTVDRYKAPHGTRDPSERQRVLVVDDDVSHLRAIARVAKRYADRLELSVVDNGIDALLKVGSLRPHLVVMDVQMPDMDGIEVCRRLKGNAETCGIKVILASSNMTPELEKSALAAGAARAVGKPFDVAAVLESVDATPVTPSVRAVGTVPPPFIEAFASGSAVIGPVVAPRRAADVMVDMLVAAGVEVVFGLPGGPISPVHDALIDSKIHVVTTRHESGALFAAAGYAHTTGRLAVALVTSGPGILNAVTGLASAWCDGLPVLLLAGEAPRRAHGKGVLQDGSAYGLNIVEMVRHVTKFAAEVPSVSQLPHLLRRAMATAMSGKRGPAVLTLPMDVTTAMIAPPLLSGGVSVTIDGSGIVPADVQALLRSAARPLILAGSGVRGNGAPARLRAVAERLGCPIATTPKAKGVFPEDHPLSLGVLGLGGHPSARTYLEGGLDILIALGTSLGDLSTDGFTPLLQEARTFVHVDIDGRQIGKSYAPTHAVVASAVEFLAGLDAASIDVVGTVATSRALGVVRHSLPPSTATDAIAPHLALAEIQQVLPADTVFTVDSGEHFLFATHYLQITAPDGFVVMTGLGSMGQSIGAAIGAQLGHRRRTVAAIVGDGCFAMNAFEVATAVAENLPIRVFVFNDERLGMVEIGHQTVYGRKPDYPTTPMDVCTLARGLGAATLRVDQPGQLLAAAELLRDHPGPVVVDVRIDPEVRLPKKDRMGAFAPRCDGPPKLRIVN